MASQLSQRVVGLWLVLSGLGIVMVPQYVAAQDAAAQDAAEGPAAIAEQDQDPRWQTLYRQQAAAYRLETRGAVPQSLELHPQPVMQWVSLNDFNGSLFLWTREGRPEVVGTLFSFPAGQSERRNLMREFYSFSAEPISATEPAGFEFSFPRGTELHPMPAAPVPLPSVARRHLQARALAREFTAHMERQGDRWELRLLNQPLYRYGEASGGVLGGAVFAFVGYITDPEILLMIEARETESGPRWCYAAARFSNKSLWLKHRDREVWTYSADAPAGDVPYFLSGATRVSVADGE